MAMATAPPWHATIRSLQRLSQVALQQSLPRSFALPGRIGQQRAWKSTESILGKSTILLQDGLDIRELPLVIRRMGAKEFPFFAGTSLSSTESLRHESEQDESFKDRLHACGNVKQVFHLLEVPGEQVTAYSASFALHRLCQVQEHSTENLNSFIQKAVFNELCDTATKEIHSLSTETVINLVRCHLRSGMYAQQYVDRIDEEVERRVGDSVLSIPDLCALICLFSEHVSGDPEVLNNIWIHLGSRYQDINEQNITRVYETLRNVTREHKYLLSVLDKKFQQCWWKLQAGDIQVIMKTLTLLNHINNKTLKDTGKWLFMNVHDIDDSRLKDILAAYTHFAHADSNVMKALERYIVSKSCHPDKTLLGLAMEYCRTIRFLSTKIFDTVATDFEKEGLKYDELQILFALRGFGQLNYVPPNSGKLFASVENVLWEKFTNFHPAHIIELLSSFVYIQRFPVNFIKRVFSPYFLGTVYDLKDWKLRYQAGRNLVHIQMAAKLELTKQATGFVNREILGGMSTILGGRWYRFHLMVGEVLEDLLGGKFFKRAETPRGTAYFIDYEICVNEDRCPMEPSDVKPKCRLALLTVMPEHYCINTKHLLGEFSMKHRHLRRLGYSVAEVYYEELMWKCQKKEKKEEYLRNILKKFMTLQQTDT